MANDNTDQIEFWNGTPGESWARHTTVVDFMFAELTDAILDAANIAAGDRVLDLGCGGGGTTLAVANKVTPVGAVTAVDVSGPMLDVAQERADDAQLVNVTFILGDAALYPFAERSFDALVSRLGSMFFDDPVEAFRRMAPSLDSGGRIALGVWRTPRENAWAMEPVSAARDFIKMPPRPGPEEPGPFAFADPDRVRQVLGDAGYTDVKLAPLDFQIPLGRTLDEALDFSMEMGPLGRPLSEATGKAREHAIAAIREVLERFQGDDGIVRLGGACWIVTARTP